MIEIVKQSQTVRSGRFESGLLTWPGEPNTHAWGTPSPTWLFPFFPVRGSGALPSTTEYAYSAPACCAHENKVQCSKRVQGRSTRLSNQVLKLTDYHISRHVASTFKHLTKRATHRDLSKFWLHQWGITTTQLHPLSLDFSRNLKSVNSYMLTRGGKPLDFYRS